MLGITEHLLTVKLRTCLRDSLFNRLAGSFEVFPLLELHFSLDLLPLDIWDKEGRDKVLDDDFGLVPLLFNLIKELVDSLDLEFGFIVGLKG